LDTIRQETFLNATSRHSFGFSSDHQVLLEQANLLCNFYVQKIPQIGQLLGLPDKPVASAITFFKRFFLHKSILQYPPDQIMITSVYLACKAEEFHIDAEELARQVKRDANQILNNELMVLEGVNFHLNVYHPYRPLYGFVSSLKDKQSQALLEKLWSGAKDLVSHSMLSGDVAFLYPPAQIALAALRVAARTENCLPTIDGIVESQFTNAGSSQLMTLHTNLREIEQFLTRKVPAINENEIRTIEYNISLLVKNKH